MFLSLPSTNRFLIYEEEERNLKLTGWDNSTPLSHSKAAFVKPYFAFMTCGSWLNLLAPQGGAAFRLSQLRHMQEKAGPCSSGDCGQSLIRE